MTKLVIDNKEIDIPPEYTLLQACEAAGAEIPPRQRSGSRTAVPVTKGLPAMHAGMLFARPLPHRRAGDARIRLLSLRVFVRLIFCESDRTERPRPRPPICQVPPAMWFALSLDRRPPAAPRPA